jgi:hypothetical protein
MPRFHSAVACLINNFEKCHSAEKFEMNLSLRFSPQGLRPEIARIIEELARAAVRREDRRAREFADAKCGEQQ